MNFLRFTHESVRWKLMYYLSIAVEADACRGLLLRSPSLWQAIQMWPPVQYVCRQIPSFLPANGADYEDGTGRESVCAGRNVVAALLAAHHAGLGDGKRSHAKQYRGRKGEDQEEG